MMRATATFQTDNWDEVPFAVVEGGPNLTRALATATYRGAIEGNTTFSLVMSYPDDASASFCGYERIVGQLGERAGSFVLRHEGTFADGTARTILTIVPGSATGALRGLHGQGESVAPLGDSATVTLDYAFE